LKKKAIQWYHDLLLNHRTVEDMIGFDNRILMAYGMCPPCKLQLEYYQLDLELEPKHIMRGTTAKVGGDGIHKGMHTMADNWTDWLVA
jgi:hypothetical protein